MHLSGLCIASLVNEGCVLYFGIAISMNMSSMYASFFIGAQIINYWRKQELDFYQLEAVLIKHLSALSYSLSLLLRRFVVVGRIVKLNMLWSSLYNYACQRLANGL